MKQSSQGDVYADAGMNERVTLQPLIVGTLVAAAVYVVDAWVIGQGGLTMLAAIFATLFAVFRACTAMARKGGRQALVHLGVVLVWGATVTLTLLSVRYQA